MNSRTLFETDVIKTNVVMVGLNVTNLVYWNLGAELVGILGVSNLPDSWWRKARGCVNFQSYALQAKHISS